MATDTNLIKIGDKEYRFKKVNIATMKKHLAFLKASNQMAVDQAAGKTVDGDAAMTGVLEMTEIVHECIVRAQPEVTLEAIEEAFDQENLAEAFRAVMTGSGFVAKGE